MLDVATSPSIAAPLAEKHFPANFLQHLRIIYTFHVDMICVSGMVKPSKAETQTTAGTNH